MMTLDFQHEIDYSIRSPCKSVLYINCVDDSQNVYLVRIINFRTFFYVHCPQMKNYDNIEQRLEGLKQDINRQMQSNTLVEKIEIVYKECFLRFKGSQNSESKFLKIFVNDCSLLSKTAALFKTGFKYENDTYLSEPYESNVNFSERLMIEKDISGMSWIQLPSNQY